MNYHQISLREKKTRCRVLLQISELLFNTVKLESHQCCVLFFSFPGCLLLPELLHQLCQKHMRLP